MGLGSRLKKYDSLIWCAFVVIGSTLLALAAGFSSYWTDSEMWPATATRYMFSDKPEYYFATKPLFHFLLYLNQTLAHFLGFHPMDTARAFMIFNSCGILFAVFLILRRAVGLDRTLVALAFLLALSVYVKRIGEVRSDVIATHILLWAVWFQISEHRARTWISIAAGIAAMLITPKATLWILCLLPIFRPPRKLVLSIALVSIALVGASFLFPGALRLVHDPLAFFIRSFNERESGLGYFSSLRFQFVLLFLRENPQFIVGVAIAVWLVVRDQSKAFANIDSRHLFQSGVLFFLLLTVYPDRLPFMIAAILPFFVLAIFSVAGNTPIRADARTFIVSAAFLMTLHWTLTTVRMHSSVPQRRFASWLQDRVDRFPPIEVFDPVGILSRTKAHNWFLGPGQVAKNVYVMEYIRTSKPEVLLYARKMTFLRPYIDKVLEDNYYGDQAGVFVRKLEIKKPGLQLNPAVLRQKLHEEFPRFSTYPNWEWIIRLTDESGLEITRPLTAKVINSVGPIAIPPHAAKLTITPFELSVPFNVNVLSLFEFDAGF